MKKECELLYDFFTYDLVRRDRCWNSIIHIYMPATPLTRSWQDTAPYGRPPINDQFYLCSQIFSTQRAMNPIELKQVIHFESGIFQRITVAAIKAVWDDESHLSPIADKSNWFLRIPRTQFLLQSPSVLPSHGIAPTRYERDPICIERTQILKTAKPNRCNSVLCVNTMENHNECNIWNPTPWKSGQFCGSVYVCRKTHLSSSWNSEENAPFSETVNVVHRTECLKCENCKSQMCEIAATSAISRRIWLFHYYVWKLAISLVVLTSIEILSHPLTGYNLREKKKGP